MTISEAISFLQPAIDKPLNVAEPRTWADFGCGGGVFTYALASFYSSTDLVTGVDVANQLDPQERRKGARVDFLQANFETQTLPLVNLSGIQMANAIHYVKDKLEFLLHCRQYLSQQHQWIIIEYDLLKSNRWVPYPLPFDQLLELFSKTGYTDIRKTNERPSRLNNSKIYCARIVSSTSSLNFNKISV